MMSKLTLDLMTVTPLLLHGNDPKEPSIQPSSFRGVFRYWTRTLLGREAGNSQEKLFEAESQIWGNTSRGSAITVRVTDTANLAVASNLRVLPERQQFAGYVDKRKFELTLSTHPLRPLFPRAGLGGILLALRLGGMGTRGRRGSGNFVVLTASSVTEDDSELESWASQFQRKPRTTGELHVFLKEDIDVAISTVPSIPPRLPDYPIFSDEHTKVLVDQQPYRSYQDALDVMWRLRSRNPFHDDPIFGLPNVKLRNFARRASPLHLHVTRTNEGYHPIMTIFRSGPEDPSKWPVMQHFVDECIKSGFVEIFGSSTRWP